MQRIKIGWARRDVSTDKPINIPGQFHMRISKGETLRPSILIDRLKRLFPRLNFSSDLLADEQEHLEMVSTPKAAYKYMTAHMRNAADGKEDSLLWWLVYDWYKRHPDEEWAHRIGMLTEGLFHQNQEPSLGREKAKI
jgi:ATP-dependent helicase/nuclease subunit B